MKTPDNRKNIICKNCKKGFSVPNHRAILAKYCSNKCLGEFKKTELNLHNKRKCKRCGVDFPPLSWYQKFCTKGCSYLFRRKKTLRSCAVCEKEFYPMRNTTKFCSPECYIKMRPKGRRKLDWDGLPHKGKNTYLDNLWREAIHKRADYKCEYCGKKSTLNAHHIFSRSNYFLRWNLDNGIALCVAHHIFGNFSAHKSPIEFVEWLKEKRGVEWYENLRQGARKTVENMFEHKEKAKQYLKLEDL